MKVGINVVNFGPGATPELFSEWARFAEAAGYHFVALSDHLAVTPDVRTQYPAPFYDPLTVLSWLAGQTSRIRLGTTVLILPHRHPLQVAKVTSNLDRLSGGRFFLGVGVGWAREEYRALGVPFERRGAIANEALEAIRLLWTHDVASYEGRHFSFHDVHTAPRPVQSPHPPIWVGGTSPAALRRAVRLGTAWHPIRVRIRRLEEKGLPLLRRIAEEESRPVPALCPRIQLRLTSEPLDEDGRLAGEGSLDQIRGDLRALDRLGAAEVTLDPYAGDPAAMAQPDDARGALETLAREILDLERERLR